jgi:hypothetical protein
MNKAHDIERPNKRLKLTARLFLGERPQLKLSVGLTSMKATPRG